MRVRTTDGLEPRLSRLAFPIPAGERVLDQRHDDVHGRPDEALAAVEPAVGIPRTDTKEARRVGLRVARGDAGELHRKAMGARNRDILVQFLSESVTITSFGAAIGVALGLGIAFLTAWIMRVQTKAPVEAAVTPGTILVVAGLSVAIGLTFGLYPARRAAGLSPIDAIRHE